MVLQDGFYTASNVFRRLFLFPYLSKMHLTLPVMYMVHSFVFVTLLSIPAASSGNASLLLPNLLPPLFIRYLNQVLESMYQILQLLYWLIVSPFFT